MAVRPTSRHSEWRGGRMRASNFNKAGEDRIERSRQSAFWWL
jgi:hypothetical protein